MSSDSFFINQTDSPLTFSIGEYIELLNDHLKVLVVRIKGEITQVKKATSGHVYFTLKDKDSGAVLDCILWRSTYQMYRLDIQIGMEVVLAGSASVYALTGRLSFVATSIELLGEGAVKRAYDALKRKLTQEGLFASERKRELPLFPQRIGILSSKQGAVIHDFTNNLGLNGFTILFRDTRVEGAEAVKDILSGIKQMEKEDIDVLVIMRGGGSIQSLAAFDNETIVRAIANFKTPVIAAIGHHQDVPLTALTSDLMVSTPTAAAHALSQSYAEARTVLDGLSQNITYRFRDVIKDTSYTLKESLTAIIRTFDKIIAPLSSVQKQITTYLVVTKRQLPRIKSELATHGMTIASSYESHIQQYMNDQELIWNHHIQKPYAVMLTKQITAIENQEKIISLNNPLRLLHLGYSIVTDKEGKLLHSIAQVAISDQLRIMLLDGIIDATIVSKEQNSHE
jgi:exodeoxyribonuclease VII large subunit